MNVFTRTTANGASHPLALAPGEVSCPNRQRSLGPGRGNASSCPTPAVRDTRRDRLNWVDSSPSLFQGQRQGRPICQCDGGWRWKDGAYSCITEKMKAVLIPKSNIPSAASNAPIIRQPRSSISPEAPRVVMESTE